MEFKSELKGYIHIAEDSCFICKSYIDGNCTIGNDNEKLICERYEMDIVKKINESKSDIKI